jgi:aminopeptidase-like protein
MSIGEDMFALAERLFPICRSITGDGVRQTLNIIKEYIPIDVHEVPTNTKVFDWTVPREWNIRDAYIKNEKGERIVDFKNSNLHVVNYSTPVNKKLTLTELKKHLFTIPENPDWIPYRTSYYDDAWGFCLTHNQLQNLKEETYEVFIDSDLKDGSLTYGEYFIEGDTDQEILLSAHVCHPSLANDNLSGITVLTHLAKYLESTSHRYSYRVIFAPGTIGSITWLARNENKINLIKHGLVVSCVGDAGAPTYKCSRQKNAEINQVVAYALKNSGLQYSVEDFSPYGYDERQYCSPGINLDVGLLERSKYGTFPEYHTSADNLGFIRPEYLEESLELLENILFILDANKTYYNIHPKCEPQLGKRGLYSAIGGDQDKAIKQLAMLWVLNQSDGTKSLLDIEELSSISFKNLHEAALLLEEHALLN